MTDRRMSRMRAKTMLKDLKKEGRLPKNYPLAAFYKLFLLQEKGERIMANAKKQVDEREELIRGMADAAVDTSFEADLVEIENDLETVTAQEVASE